jgi:ribosome production factor 1
MILVHLPEGPTAHFQLTNITLSKDIHHHGNPTDHIPELIMNNFNTKIGRRIGRFFASLFPQNPEFKGRTVVTFHNQRDFIFFRHHRYIFGSEGEKVNL